ncbi:MAG: Gfo/Idh/MocA family oxidoreductase [Elusimicrobia bacterium]|nr:Gfo/Idh/MocA family oxidoreductase [Elusimicrobiota bacterium]
MVRGPARWRDPRHHDHRQGSGRGLSGQRHRHDVRDRQSQAFRQSERLFLQLRRQPPRGRGLQRGPAHRGEREPPRELQAGRLRDAGAPPENPGALPLHRRRARPRPHDRGGIRRGPREQEASAQGSLQGHIRRSAQAGPAHHVLLAGPAHQSAAEHHPGRSPARTRHPRGSAGSRFPEVRALSKALQGAIIGFGVVAQDAHAPAFARAEGFEIAAVADSSSKRLAAARKIFPNARIYPSARKLYAAEKLDFVDIATPPHLHAELCLEALRRRLHVLCEKPLVFTRGEFEALRAQAQRQKRALFPVHNWKYAPALSKLHALLRAGSIGELRHIELHVLRSKPAAASGLGSGSNWRLDRSRAGGGILVDHGWHNIYLLMWLSGAAPVDMQAVLQTASNGLCDEEAACLLRFPRASALMYLSWRSPRRAQWGVAYGRCGSIELLDDRLILSRNSGAQTFRFPQKLSAGSAHPEWFAAMLPDFRAAIARPASGLEFLEEAGACAALIERAYRAAEAPRAKCAQWAT